MTALRLSASIRINPNDLPPLSAFYIDPFEVSSGHLGTSYVGGKEPVVGDIVSCKWPELDAPNQAGPKARPCLVLGSAKAGNGLLFLVVAACTSKRVKTAKAATEIALIAERDYKSAGLNDPTRFELTNRQLLPYVHSFFRANSHDTAIMGRIPEKHFPRVAASARPLVVEKKRRRSLRGREAAVRPKP
jgi:mRNA-degrading endonuclease toxin of MazEF toxin-antitoxin module